MPVTPSPDSTLVTLATAKSSLDANEPATRRELEAFERRILEHGGALFCSALVDEETAELAVLIIWKSRADLDRYAPTEWHAEDRRVLARLREEPVRRFYYRSITGSQADPLEASEAR
jgi:hypothetical protein